MVDSVDVHLVIVVRLAEDAAKEHKHREDNQVRIHEFKVQLEHNYVGQPELKNGEGEDGYIECK